MNRDLERLKEEYAARSQRLAGADRYSWLNPAQAFLLQGRARALLKALRQNNCGSLENLRFLEIGCGSGGVLKELVAYGASSYRLTGIDILETRLQDAKKNLPGSLLLQGNAAELPLASQQFDVVLQFTALSSLLDPALRQAVCAEMLRALRPGGLILSYDFWYNPFNPQTRGLSPAEIRQLFSGCQFQFQRLSLAAPLARWIVPRSWGLASLLEGLQVFNTHYLTTIKR